MKGAELGGLRDGGSATAWRHGGRFQTLVEAVLRMPMVWRWVCMVALVALVAAIDLTTGTEISFSLFYLLPVTFAAALVSRRAGWVAACLSAVVWGYLDIVGHAYSAAWIPIWNATIRLGFFLIVSELVWALGVSHARLREQSVTDPLTGLANTRRFVDQARRIIAEARRSGQGFTLAYVDLDRFKLVNDKFGHQAGDSLLRSVATVMRDNARETDVVARLGGDEFGILMPGTDLEQARASLTRIAAAVGVACERPWAAGATFGAVTFAAPPADVDFAVGQADALMLRGKKHGRGCVLQAVWPPRPLADGFEERAQGATLGTDDEGG